MIRLWPCLHVLWIAGSVLSSPVLLHAQEPAEGDGLCSAEQLQKEFFENPDFLYDIIVQTLESNVLAPDSDGLVLQVTGYGRSDFNAHLSWTRDASGTPRIQADVFNGTLRAQLHEEIVEKRRTDVFQVLTSLSGGERRRLDEQQCPDLRRIHDEFRSEWLAVRPADPPPSTGIEEINVVADGSTVAVALRNERQLARLELHEVDGDAFRWGIAGAEAIQRCLASER